MSKIVYCNNKIKDIHYSGFTITKVYACDGELVYSASTEPPTPPVTSDKVLYTISGTSYSIPCDGNSTLTKLEIQQDLYEKTRQINVEDITDAVIGDCVTTLDGDCFNHSTSLTSVTIPNSVTTIMEDAFYVCTSLSSITIPNSVTSIGNNAFDTTHLSSVTIPSSITTIESHTFDNCIYLNDIVIPSSVTSIGDYAFHFELGGEEPERSITTALARNRRVTILATTPPTLGVGVFQWSGTLDATYPIYVPSSSVDAYKAAWTLYADRIQPIQ